MDQLGSAKDHFDAVSKEVVDGAAVLKVVGDSRGDRGMPCGEGAGVEAAECFPVRTGRLFLQDVADDEPLYREHGQAGLPQVQSSADEGAHGQLRDGREGR